MAYNVPTMIMNFFRQLRLGEDKFLLLLFPLITFSLFLVGLLIVWGLRVLALSGGATH